MSLVGTWNAQIASPMGLIEPVFKISEGESGYEGVAEMRGDTVKMFDVTLDGEAASWKMRMSSPMPMTIKIAATLVENALDGTAKAGMMPAAKFTATRE